MLYSHAQLPAPLGQLLLLSDDGTTLTGLYFANQPHAPAIKSSWQHEPNTEVFVETVQQLNSFLRGTLRTFNIQCRFTHGTEFQQAVWNLLATIAHGTTCSYSDLAAMLRSPHAVRAVGAAVACNPISVVMPCHRVVGKNGELTGYAGGLERKKALLELER